MALVLCIGVERLLMTTRKLILEGAGHKVVMAMDESALKTSCQQHDFDVAVIGQTASAKIKRQFMTLVRQHCPTAKILELYLPNTGPILGDADSWLQVPTDVPGELAERVNSLASSRSQKNLTADDAD